MDMLIDDARQQKTAGTIDQLIAIMNGQLCFSGNLSDTTVLNEDRSPKTLAFVHERCILDDDSVSRHNVFAKESCNAGAKVRISEYTTKENTKFFL